MPDIITLLACFDQWVEKTTLRQMSRVIVAMLSMTGRVTMRGIARWSEPGGSYRTVQRLFDTTIPWATLLWLFVQQHLLHKAHTYLLAGDETVVTKAGKTTYGLDRFFSSLYGKPVPGLAFFTLALVSVQERRAYPVLIEQRVRTPEERAAAAQKAPPRAPTKRQRGRPKGSRNRDKQQIEWTPELHLVQRMLQTLLARVAGALPLAYLVLDGHFGNNNALQMVRQSSGLHLISKLRADSALYMPYTGPQKQFGPRRRYGDKLNYQALPDPYCVSSRRNETLQTDIYQATLLHKCFACPLNVVSIVKRNLRSGACAHVVLFSNDLTLTYDCLIEYYQLRFQLEFNFRDAKQFWGLEDFMNVKERAVTNAVNLAFFMVNLAHCLLRTLRHTQPQAGIHDLKTLFHARKYVSETLKRLPQPPDAIISERIIHAVATLGCIHPPATNPESP